MRSATLLATAAVCGFFVSLPSTIAAPVPQAVTEQEKYDAAVIAAIHLFAERGEVDHLRALLEKHPKLVNERQRFRQPRKPLSTDSYTALHWAARTGRAEVAALLLEHKADLNADAGGGWTPLHVAAHAGNLDTVKVLVEHGAKVDAKTVAQPERVMVPPSSPPGAQPVRFPAVPAMTPLDVALEFKKPAVAAYLKSAMK